VSKLTKYQPRIGMDQVADAQPDELTSIVAELVTICAETSERAVIMVSGHELQEFRDIALFALLRSVALLMARTKHGDGDR